MSGDLMSGDLMSGDLSSQDLSAPYVNLPADCASAAQSWGQLGAITLVNSEIAPLSCGV
jgi:hypothetical protein